MANLRAVEKGAPPPPPLDSQQEQLEGLSSNAGVLARKVSAVKRVVKIRTTHVARVGHIFFYRTRFGNIIFNLGAGKKLMDKMFFGFKDSILDLE
jgi:hypothetical protein